jgi:formamidopyrimidine-DNA glycosylase
MPELPEVETIRQQLKKYLTGHKITNVEIRYGKKFEGDPKLLIGGKIVDVRRFGKVQSIDLDNGYSLVIHIKMTGQLIYVGPNLKPIKDLSKKITGGIGGKHTHIIFKLDKDGVLYYNDVRKFGWLKIVVSDKVVDDKFVGKLGPEPFVGETSSGQSVLTFEKFTDILSKTSRPIKLVLMDQEKIGGIGNIYANDALWLALVNPKTPVKQLSNEVTKQLFDAIHTVLNAGLKYGGASELSFVTPDGAEGEYQNHTLVYGHEGELCKRCKKAKLEKYFLGGRGTYWCPFCQQH